MCRTAKYSINLYAAHRKLNVWINILFYNQISLVVTALAGYNLVLSSSLYNSRLRFESRVSAQFGLEKVANNTAEGLVLRPVKHIEVGRVKHKSGVM